MTPRVARCGNCGEAGHYRPKCPKRADAVPVRYSPSGLHDPTRKPAPEPTRPVLSPWIAPTEGTKPSAVLVRLDQAGRVRAAIDDLPGRGWCGWVIRDVTGAVVGKIGMTSGMRDGEPSTADARLKAEQGADEALVKLGWLLAGHVVPMMQCARAAPACSAKTVDRPSDMTDTLRAALATAAEVARSAGWSEQDFAALAARCFRKDPEAQAA